MKDILFLARPGFMDGERGPLYCGDCVGVEGLLSFFPVLRDLLDVRYIDVRRPREPVVALIGEANQGLPVLVLGERADADAAVGQHTSDERPFINDPVRIREYLSAQYGVASQG